jgi:hypothetical protein
MGLQGVKITGYLLSFKAQPQEKVREIITLNDKQRTTKGWHTSVDHLITPRGFGTTL